MRAWGGDPGVSPHGSHSSDPNNYFGHNSFVYWACINHGFPLPYNAADVATEPDGWPQDVTESVILPLTDEQKTGFEAVIHSWDHYYNPDWDTGFAPSFTYYWAYLARGNYTSNQLSSALYLGWASHFLTDVSNPEHTGFEFEQYADKLLGGYNTHVAYEGYVSAMWNQTHPGQTGISTFHQIVKNQVNINYRITNPNTATKNIAKFSHAYLPTLYYRIANQPYIDSNHRGFYDDATVGRITDNCLRVAARYTGGLVDYTQSHTINEIPIADFTANPVFLLSGGTVQFLDKTQYSGPLTTHVDWNFGDGLAHYTADPPKPYTAVNPVHPYTTPGVYTVNLTVSNANGVTSKTMDIGVGNWPTANFDTEAVVAEPAYTYHFTDKSTNTPNHWTWDFGDGSTSTEQNPTHKFDSIHNYDITLVASNIAGPGKVTKTIIPISSKPVAFFIIACGKNGPAPLVTQFMDNSIGWIESRTWDFGDNTTSNEKDPTHIYNKTGIYTVKLTVVSIGAGTSTNTSTISVTPPYPPLAKFTASPRSGPAPLTVRFTDTSTGLPNTWLWNFGDGNGTNATERNPVHTYYTNGSFNASLTATNVGGSNTITKQKYICVGDCRERVGIYQDGSWYIDLNGDGMYNTGDRNAGFGAPLWAPVLGDWNGDGTREIGVYRDGSWYLDYDNSGSWNVGDKNYGYGAINWAPVVGDWSGTGSDKVGAYQDGAWYLDSNGNGVFDAGDKNYAFGGAGWTPVVGRWTSDGKTKIGVYRDGTYYIDYNGDGIYNAGDKTIVYGTSGSTAITGDWNGDGLTEVGTQGGNIWKLDYDGLGAVNASTKTYTFGSPGWSPVVGDWNADGRSKIGIYQNGSWYLDYNGDGVYSSDDKNYALGTAGWMPVTGKW